MGAGSRWDKALLSCWQQAALQVSHISWLLWDFQPQGVILRSLQMRITQWHFWWFCCFSGEDVLALFYKGFLPATSSVPSSRPHPVCATRKQKRKAKFSDQRTPLHRPCGEPCTMITALQSSSCLMKFLSGGDIRSWMLFCPRYIH